MHVLDAISAPAYLRDAGRLATQESVRVRELPGGVSNMVLWVEFDEPARKPIVVKQAREKLRVVQEWLCSPERIWREVAFLEACEKLLGNCRHGRFGLRTPQVLFTDPEQFLFGMTAASADAVMWKEQLLDLQFDESIAAACGHLLGTLHANSWGDGSLQQAFAQWRYFDDLRIDPYYRRIAQVHPQIRPAIDELIVSLQNNRVCLVHGDFSPKNLLVSSDEIVLIDCEVGHYGDPTFDLGFFLSHLVLKGIATGMGIELMRLIEAFLASYLELVAPHLPGATRRDFELRLHRNLAACLLARVDGKSPVNYLDERQQQRVRRYALPCLMHDPVPLSRLTTHLHHQMTGISL